MAIAKMMPNTDGVNLSNRGIFSLVAAQAVALISGILTQLAASRALAPTDYSTYALVNLVSLFSLVVLIGGLPLALRRFVSIQPERLAAAVALVLRTQVPIAIIFGLILISLRGPLATLFSCPDLAPLLLLLAIEIVLRAGLLEPCLHLLNGSRMLMAQSTLVIVYSIGRLALIAGLLALGAGLAGAILGLMLAALFSSILTTAVLIARNAFHFSPRVEVRWSRDVLPWFKYSCGYEVLSFTLLAMNLWIVKAMRPTDTQLGPYAVASMIARATLSVAQVLSGGTFAWLARAHAEQDRSRFREILARLTITFTCILVPINLLAFLYGADVLECVCGPAYNLENRFLCGLLCAGTSLAAASLCLGEVLGSASQLAARLLLAAITFAISLALTVVLAHYAGLAGAAWALITGEAFFVSALCGLVRVTMGAFVPWRLLGLIGLAAAPALLVRMTLGSPTGIFAITIQIAMTFAVFVLTLVVMRRICFFGHLV